jgi:hypothetical protein
LRLKSKEVKKQFNRVILLEDLATDEVYNHLVKVWESYYNAFVMASKSLVNEAYMITCIGK